MDEKIPNMIDDEILRQLEKLKTLKPESKEYHDTLNAIGRLHDMKLDSEKVELEFNEKREKRLLDSGRADEELRLKEAEEKRLQDQAVNERKQFWIRLAADTGILIVNLAFLGIQFKRGFKFEKDGVLTSTTFREIRGKAFGSLFKRK